MNIIITGASAGIGFETALLLSKDRDNTVFAIARRKDKLDQLYTLYSKKENSGKLITIPFDLEKGSYSELVSEVLNHVKTIDIIINNAGLLISKPFAMLTDNDWSSMFNVNVLGPVKLVRAFIEYIGKEGRGHIVNIGSMGGVQGSAKFTGLSAYSSSKGMLACLSECLAEEFKDSNIAVNCLALGAVQTEMLSLAFPGYVAPLSSEEMATFIANFALNASGFINGKVIPVSLSTP